MHKSYILSQILTPIDNLLRWPKKNSGIGWAIIRLHNYHVKFKIVSQILNPIDSLLRWPKKNSGIGWAIIRLHNYHVKFKILSQIFNPDWQSTTTAPKEQWYNVSHY